MRCKGKGREKLWSYLSLCLLRSTRASLCASFTDVRGGGLIHEKQRHGIHRSTQEEGLVVCTGYVGAGTVYDRVNGASFLGMKSCLIHEITKTNK